MTAQNTPSYIVEIRNNGRCADGLCNYSPTVVQQIEGAKYRYIFLVDGEEVSVFARCQIEASRVAKAYSGGKAVYLNPAEVVARACAK